MKICYQLNSDCLKLHEKVETLFIFDNDDIDTFIYDLLGITLWKVMGMKTINNHTFQISYYIMPNSKVFAVAYPSCTVVNFNEAEDDIKDFFNNIPCQDSSYQFYLTLIENGYTKRKFV